MTNAAPTPDTKAAAAPRRERIPFNSMQKKLDVMFPEGWLDQWHPYWFLDDGDRVPRALAGGYDFVKHNEITINDGVLKGNSALDDKVRRLAGKHANGDPAYLFLMKIPVDMWTEDQRALEEHNDRIRQSLFAGTIGNSEAAHSYVGGTAMTGKGPKLDVGQAKSLARPGSPDHQSRIPPR
jgi:hypothetical protein